MREIIKVKNVSKVYKINKRKSGLFGAVLNLFAPRYEKKIAVSDMNFSIEEGEAVAFIGSNGAGKSTTIKMLSGILYPSEGEITVASYVPYKQRKKYVSNIGVVLGQKSQLVWDLPVRDGYELIRHIYKISKEDYEKRLLNIKECDENIVEIMFEKPKLQLERVSKYLNDNYLVKSIRPMSSEQDILEVVTKDSQMIVDTTIYESEKIHDNHFRIKLKDVNTQLGATLNKFVTEYDIKDVLIKEPEISEIVYNIYEGKVELKK